MSIFWESKKSIEIQGNSTLLLLHGKGYYKCSSSKGCPTIQVTRSHLDPTSLLITYSCDHHHHNHYSHRFHFPFLIHRHYPAASFPSDECAAFANRLDIEPAVTSFVYLADQLGWLCDVEPMTDRTTLVGSRRG
ncbi:hypothetical protein RD792_007120 [Penstemon davidsonii]|uniref:WRKY domain-containing protein n=1 Tax=Penstemon davidsonii TaxID=160366 RepID=A0ABR0D6J2_9LAMI|nr:hypothetical protein RD792_007120 [Penstemon davidsonii]